MTPQRWRKLKNLVGNKDFAGFVTQERISIFVPCPVHSPLPTRTTLVAVKHTNEPQFQEQDGVCPEAHLRWSPVNGPHLPSLMPQEDRLQLQRRQHISLPFNLVLSLASVVDSHTTQKIHALGPALSRPVPDAEGRKLQKDLAPDCLLPCRCSSRDSAFHARRLPSSPQLPSGRLHSPQLSHGYILPLTGRSNVHLRVFPLRIFRLLLRRHMRFRERRSWRQTTKIDIL